MYQRMKNYPHPWAIAGGWSIDLFLNKVTRHHHDIEIIIFRENQQGLKQYLSGWVFTKVANGVISSWDENEWLPLPIHETYAQHKSEKIEILLNEKTEDVWVYRRDSRIIRELQKTILYTKEEVPFLSPEIALLYKSKQPRSKDIQDFNHVFEKLYHEQKSWLTHALKTLYKDHPWL